MARGVSLLALLIFFLLFELDDRLTRPSCRISGQTGAFSSHLPDDLRVMMVADLLLHGTDSSYVDSWFRDPFTSRYQVVIRLQQFYTMLGPHFSLPLHILPGDRDMGKCSNLHTNIISMTADHVPALDSAGCSVFEIANVSFVSLNSMALLCGEDELRFGIEKVVERESDEFQRRTGVDMDRSSTYVEESEMSGNFQWRENGMRTGTGPVVLLHLPLHQPDGLTEVAHKSYLYRRGEEGSYELTQTLPANSTEYIFRTLKPRIVFSAHAHKFSDSIHPDGTHEVTVPAMTWATNEKPGFAFVIFGQNNTISVSHCILAPEWHVLAFDFVVLLSLLAIALVVHRKTFGK